MKVWCVHVHACQEGRDTQAFGGYSEVKKAVLDQKHQCNFRSFSLQREGWVPFPKPDLICEAEAGPYFWSQSGGEAQGCREDGWDVGLIQPLDIMAQRFSIIIICSSPDPTTE